MQGIRLDRENPVTLRRQIYQALRDQMTDGRLKAGEPLSSTRELSKSLNISRSTVCEAYDMLIAEGFAVSRQGAPTRVAEGLFMEALLRNAPEPESVCENAIQADFRTGRPDLRLFPRYLWMQMLNRAGDEMPPEYYGYTGAQGLFELRQEISAWLFRIRGLTVDPGNIFITQGATHALHLITELVCGNGRAIMMEDPCHTGMLQTLRNKGCRIEAVPVDECGIRTDLLDLRTCTGEDETDKVERNVGAIYVTPAHQFPLGGILPASRRTSLIRYAKEKKAYIVEDDYDSEFRFCGEPVAPLYSMAPERVIYVGTFSKTVFPALRVGYVILPRELHRQWKHLRTHTDVQNPIFEQAALAEFLAARKLDRHVRSMRRQYGERRKVLLDSMTETFGTGFKVYGDNAGLHVAIEFPGFRFDDQYRKSALNKGIAVTPMEYHCIEKGRHMNKLILGYGHLDQDEIRNGTKILYEHMEEYFR